MAADLSSRLGSRRIDRLELVSFTALKTFEPSVSVVSGGAEVWP